MIHDDCPVRKTVNRGGQPGVQRPGGQLQVEPWHCGWDPQAANQWQRAGSVEHVFYLLFFWRYRRMKWWPIYLRILLTKMTELHRTPIIFAEVEVSRISTTGAGLEIWTVSDQSLVFCIFQVSLEPGNWPCPKDDIRFHMSLGIFVALVWLHVSKAVAEVKSASPSGIPRAPAEATGPVMGGHHFWTHHHTRSQTS